MLSCRIFLALALLAAIAFPAFGPLDKPKPAPADPTSNALTPKEAAEGWISLFDGESTFGWKTEGEVAVKEAALCLLRPESAGASAAFAAQLPDGELSFEYRLGKDGQLELAYGASDLHLPPTGEAWQAGSIRLVGGKASEPKILGLTPDRIWARVGNRIPPPGVAAPPPDRLLFFRIPSLVGAVLLPNDSAKQAEKPKPPAPAAEGWVRNVRFRPAGLESIFNGKDLSGWKAVEGKPSKFTITPEGELNIKDGPGDLHTEGQWDDFVLQLEVKSNGKHLNSGVFFRCVPNEFWSGYEAQIRNQWKDGDRSKPVDFGTGGLYNRQPARKVFSTDGEWFTMTVLARGTHIAIWVNGQQTVDFVEKQKLGNNARRGGKTAAGTISLQGHDATTDLSFRNIRIAPLPKLGG